MVLIFLSLLSIDRLSPSFPAKMAKLHEDSKPKFEQVIRDWLTEYKSLSNVSLNEYASKIMEKENVVNAFHEMLFSTHPSTVLELVQSGCHQLFEFYRSGNNSLELFTICIFPSMVGAYLRIASLCSEDSSELVSSLGTFLLSIYNLICGAMENMNCTSLFSENGIEIPDISHSSIYHDSMVYPFSERILSTPSQRSNQVCAKLPVPTTYDSIIPSNRSKILYTIMSCYFDNITFVAPSSLSHVCKLCLLIGCCGYPWHQIMLKINRSKQDRRVVVAPDLVIIILRSVYFALYNNHRSEAMKALQAMQKRARYELSSQVLLMCNAILNTAYQEKSKVSGDAPLGLTSAVTPMLTRTSSKGTRQAVTAKSIKHHKWLHANEEVSGDYTESLIQDVQPSTNALESIPSITTLDAEETNKIEKTSPAKILKARMKRNTPFPSMSPSEKPRSLALQSNEKKVRKPQGSESGLEHRSRTPSGGQAVELSSQKPAKLSSTSVPSLKQLSIEDVTKRNAGRSSSITKEDSYVAKVHEPLLQKLSEESSNTSNLKKSKSDRKNKSKLGKEDGGKELKSLMNEKTKTPAEAVPFLDKPGAANVENSHSVTTTL